MKKSDIESSRKKVRVSARINAQLLLLFKLACKEMGISIESRIEFLIREDVKKSIKGEWFKSLTSSKDKV